MPIEHLARSTAAALATVALCASVGFAQPTRFTTDDGVSIYYDVVGGGPQTVVVPMSIYLRDALARLATPDRRLVFYDPRHRGRSGRGSLDSVNLDRQVRDLEQLRAHLRAERIALIGWSGLGMETAVYAIRHPSRVSRLVQVGAVPPAASIMRQAGGDARATKVDTAALAALDRRYDAGEFRGSPREYCAQRDQLTRPSNFANAAFASRVPDVCQWENEWPVNLWPYFGKLLASFGDYDWRPQLARLDIPRLVIHGREDGIPVAGARAWAAGFDSTRLLVLSPAGHFPFLERPDDFFPAVDLFLRGVWPGTAERVAGPGGASAPNQPSDDVTSLDGIIAAYYDVISGPAGSTPDAERDARLHHPSALVAITGARDGRRSIRTMSLREYHASLGGPRSAGFFEREISRQVQRFGNVAHVWSTYESSRQPAAKPFARGINSIQLYHDGTRWWITSWIFDSERRDNPIPREYLVRPR